MSNLKSYIYNYYIMAKSEIN